MDRNNKHKPFIMDEIVCISRIIAIIAFNSKDFDEIIEIIIKIIENNMQ